MAVGGEERIEALYAKIPNNDKVAGCLVDPLGLAAMPQVQEAVASLTLTGVQINFIGCPEGRFEILMGIKDSPSRVAYAIYYPNKERSQFSLEEMIAPIVHEVAHIFQSEQYGSIGKLRSHQCIERIELGADFLTGFIFANVLRLEDKALFQTNLSLAGDFDKTHPQNHGTPSYRASAFRMGYYIAQSRKVNDLKRAYSVFQNADFFNIFANDQDIIRNCP